MRQKVNLVVNLVTPEAQALELAKSELKRKGEDNLMGRGRKTATMDWNSLRCLMMNRKQLYNMLIGYQVIRWPYADHLKIQRGRYVISNMDTSQGRGEHWVTFCFPKLGPYEFFDPLGHMPNPYKTIWKKKRT